jgi:hypothetical protein
MAKLFAVGISLAFAVVIALSALAVAPAQAARGDWCRRASQCHGPLPDICRRCDGHSRCAHWACIHHRCVIRICP